MLRRIWYDGLWNDYTCGFNHLNLFVSFPFSRRVSQGLLKPVGGKLRPPSGSMSSSSRPIPLKASHQLTMATQTLTLQSSDDNNNSAASDHISTVQKDRDRQRKARKDLKMDSSDLGYLCSEQPSHVQIRTGKAENSSSANARVVRVGRISKPVVAEDNCSTEEKRLLIPSPPSSAKPAASQRPTSASRFRRMVLHCRDGTWHPAQLIYSWVFCQIEKEDYQFMAFFVLKGWYVWFEVEVFGYCISKICNISKQYILLCVGQGYGLLVNCDLNTDCW